MPATFCSGLVTIVYTDDSVERIELPTSRYPDEIFERMWSACEEATDRAAAEIVPRYPRAIVPPICEFHSEETE